MQEAGSGRARRLIPSRHLRIFAEGGREYLYHTCLGNPVVVSEGYSHFVRVMRNGFTIQEIRALPNGEELAKQVETLVQLGLFVPLGREKDVIGEQVAENERKIGTGELIDWLVLNLTTDCNLACTYCSVRESSLHRREDAEPNMSLDTARRALHEFIELCMQNGKAVGKVIYYGGEPLLHYEVFRRIMHYVHALNEELADFQILHGLNTNGMLLNARVVDELKQTDCHVGISLDGLQEEHDQMRVTRSGRGTHSVVVGNARMLVAQGVPTIIKATVNEANFRNLNAFVGFLAEHGFENVNLQEDVRGVGSASYLATNQAEKVDRLIEAIEYGRRQGLNIVRTMGDKTRSCEGIGQMLSVLPTGDIYPCPGGIGIRIGRVGRMERIPRSPQYRYVASRIIGNLEECVDCDVEGLCKGGCAAQAERKYGDIYRVNREHCDYLRMLCKRMLVSFGGPV